MLTDRAEDLDVTARRLLAAVAGAEDPRCEAADPRGSGSRVDRADWETIVPAILEHTAQVRAASER
jgi:hypothetical protein